IQRSVRRPLLERRHIGRPHVSAYATCKCSRDSVSIIAIAIGSGATATGLVAVGAAASTANGGAACTGRSAGFSPLRMRSTYSGARRTEFFCAVGDFAASALSGAEPVETLLLLVAERAIKLFERGLNCLHRAQHRVEPLLHRLQTADLSERPISGAIRGQQ